MKKIYVIAYDIHSNKRRNKVAELLEKHGRRINLSVFECPLTFYEYENILYEIHHLINPRTDTVKIYPLTRDCYARSIVFGRRSDESDFSMFDE